MSTALFHAVELGKDKGHYDKKQNKVDFLHFCFPMTRKSFFTLPILNSFQIPVLHLSCVCVCVFFSQTPNIKLHQLEVFRKF